MSVMKRERLCAQMRRENTGPLEQMLTHRFVEDIKRDRLDRGVFERYLIYERSFVETAITIFSYATAKASTIAQKRRLISILDVLINQQTVYFDRALVELDIDTAAYSNFPPVVQAFRSEMLSIAREGDFLEIIAAMFSAEWMYWCWSVEASSSTISLLPLKTWVELHTSADFAAQVRWLEQLLDDHGDGLNMAERARLSAIFGRVQRLEIAFHDGAYQSW